MIPLAHFLYLSAFLFSVGLAIVLVKKNVIVVLMGLELMLNAANINLVAFSQYDQSGLFAGQMFALFVIIVAAAEVAVGLAIVLKVFRYYESAELDDLKDLNG